MVNTIRLRSGHALQYIKYAESGEPHGPVHALNPFQIHSPSHLPLLTSPPPLHLKASSSDLSPSINHCILIINRHAINYVVD